MKLIYECFEKDNRSRCVIRTRTYCASFEHIQMLVSAARNDFDVADDDIKVVLYSGQHYSRQYGIEFNPIEQTIPLHYRKITQLETTYNC